MIYLKCSKNYKLLPLTMERVMQSVCLFRYLLIRFICMQDNPKSGGLIWIDFHG